MDKIIILDFGSQTTALIGRRIRELGVYTEILPGNTQLTAGTLVDARGVILSGSPESVYTSASIAPDQTLYTSGLPLLGICYGLQRMVADLGGTVGALPQREYGNVGVRVTMPNVGDGLAREDKLRAFFAGFDKLYPLAKIIEGNAVPAVTTVPEAVSFTSWMSHGDTLIKLPYGFRTLGTSASGFPAVVIHEAKPIFGVQFHPEVTHCERGLEILAAFVFGVCECKAEWSMQQYIGDVDASLKQAVGQSQVLLLVSGGVDSTVAAALLLKTLPADQVRLMYMDTGLMRKDETSVVKTNLERLGAKHLHIIHCEDEFLDALKGIEEPEAKRKIIGDLFIAIQEREVAKLGLPETYFLAQGTLYTDLIESGKGVGNQAHLIKSHHNVGSPLVDAKRKAGRVIEPLDKLYKDEVRRLGRLLALDDAVVKRHPFPGPGLAIRILGEVNREKCAILREADAIYIEEIKRRGLYDEIWQAFAVLLPLRSVGVAGDERKYGWVLSLRAVTSADGMTADVYPFPVKDLVEISTRITNTVKDIGRVTYDISSKPPATIEWE
ncbi:MAG: glutamine-hydrolyzing GMP synthase [Treponema sp.]|jgi:GMP synthase (glutamine-hydrolysing)|nr:glutamine-hydrolyzing GMP synthase [Treponema sp.]